MTAIPQFAATPASKTVSLAVANANRDGTGTLVTVITGAANGTRIENVTIQGAVTTTAGLVRLFVDDGSTVRLFEELVVDAVTVSATVPGHSAEFTKITSAKPLYLNSATDILKANTEKAEAITVSAIAANF